MATMKSANSILDAINILMNYEKSPDITKRKFKEIRNNGTEEELEAAIEKMEAAGGYDALADE